MRHLLIATSLLATAAVACDAPAAEMKDPPVLRITSPQRSLIQNQQAEIIRVNALYDAELQRLSKLWSGVQPGTLGALPPAPAGSTPAQRKAAGK